MAQQKRGPITLAGVGDVSPNRDDPPSIFRYCRDALHAADILFGQLECPLSDKGTPQFIPTGNCHLRAKNISALTEEGAGFDVMSFAGNHAMDYGEEALFDTIQTLGRHGIAVAGAGRNIHEARRPAILERDGTRFGFLAYLSALYPGLEAEDELPGLAPLRAFDYYRRVDMDPGNPPLIVSAVVPEYLRAMEEDVKKLRPQVDVVVVSIHAGVDYVRAMIAMFQKEAAHAAIDAGADLVLQHHAHILKGIEVYKGKTVFYGLGNFAAEHGLPHSRGPARRDRTERPPRCEVWQPKPIPGYEKFHYMPDSIKTMIAKAYVQDKRVQKVTYIPANINPDLEPVVLKRQDPRAQEVFDYVQQISAEEDLKARFSWDGDEVLVSG